MIDRRISATSTLAYSFWITGAVLIVLNFIFEPPLGLAGLFLAGVGGVAQIRGFLCALQRRELNAFELGRDFEQSQTVVHPINRR